MKPRLKLIQQTGLSWHKQYAEIGDAIEVWPLVRLNDRPRSFYVEVINVVRNRYGRISYETPRYPGFGERNMVFTEELTPLGHKGCK